MSRPVPVILLGLGGVGGALLRLIHTTRETQARRGIEFRPLVVADATGAIVDERGLDEGLLESALRLKARGGALHEHEAGYYQSAPEALVELVADEETLLFDATAADPELLVPAFDLLLARGGRLVLANKKPLTADLTTWSRLTADGRTGYEATVGAALPVIATLRGLLDSGDEVRRIEGAFSGTLGYLMSELEAGTPFSVALTGARERGWTEPDPRDDLSGMDVARKALILARTLGASLGMADVTVDPLDLGPLDTLPLDSFLSRLAEADERFRARVERAHAACRRLRYGARLEGETITVGPLELAPESPLGALRGPDNLVAFTTGRYPRPLVIQGAGAGVELTASAMLTDALRLCG